MSRKRRPRRPRLFPELPLGAPIPPGLKVALGPDWGAYTDITHNQQHILHHLQAEREASVTNGAGWRKSPAFIGDWKYNS